MDLDMLDSTAANKIVDPFQEAAEKNLKVCRETLKRLGYEISDGQGKGVGCVVKKGNVQYKLAFEFDGPQSGEFFRVPVGNHSSDTPTIFNMEADVIAFYQKGYENGTIFQFRLSELRDLVKPLVTSALQKVKDNTAFYAFTASGAIEGKRVHAVYCERSEGYDFYIYLPIKVLCDKMKHSKQAVGR